MMDLWVAKVDSLDQFAAYAEHVTGGIDWRSSIEAGVVPPEDETLFFDGICGVCERATHFRNDYQYAHVLPDGSKLPNIRERLECEHCGLNTRMRATIHFMKQFMASGPDSSIYVTEQITSMFSALSQRFENVVGSEYLGADLSPGATNDHGVRNEDCTSLSFGRSTFDTIVSLDVLEHIPDHKKALLEFFRCLKPGGRLLLTVPFDLESAVHIERAKIVDGRVVHMLPPEYHGDPLSQQGVLCYRHFGWSLLDELKQTGFRETALYFYWSKRLGYLGGWPFLISATV